MKRINNTGPSTDPWLTAVCWLERRASGLYIPVTVCLTSTSCWRLYHALKPRQRLIGLCCWFVQVYLVSIHIRSYQRPCWSPVKPGVFFQVVNDKFSKLDYGRSGGSCLIKPCWPLGSRLWYLHCSISLLRTTFSIIFEEDSRKAIGL